MGSTLYFRTDEPVGTLITQYQAEPRHMAAHELLRMRQVNRSIDLYKYIEMELAAAGLALIARHFGRPDSFWLGLGTALPLDSLLMLGADLGAEHRADRYTAQVEVVQRRPVR